MTLTELRKKVEENQYKYERMERIHGFISLKEDVIIKEGSGIITLELPSFQSLETHLILYYKEVKQ